MLAFLYHQRLLGRKRDQQILLLLLAELDFLSNSRLTALVFLLILGLDGTFLQRIARVSAESSFMGVGKVGFDAERGTTKKVDGVSNRSGEYLLSENIVIIGMMVVTIYDVADCIGEGLRLRWRGWGESKKSNLLFFINLSLSLPSQSSLYSPEKSTNYNKPYEKNDSVA